MKKDGKKRVWFLLIFCTAVFAAFLVRLYWMQFTMADHYAKKLEQASQTSYTGGAGKHCGPQRHGAGAG